MSRSRLNSGIEVAIEQMALGMSVRGARLFTRRDTLDEIGRDAVRYAQDLADRRLPSNNTAGGRNPNYPFRSTRDGEKTYRASFYSRVTVSNGRLGIEVGNTHKHATTVEFGNDGSGPVIQARKGSMLAIPITNKFYKQLKGKKNLKKGKRVKSGNGVSYPVMFDDGPYWMRESVQAYSGYGIMRDVLTYIASRLA